MYRVCVFQCCLKNESHPQTIYVLLRVQYARIRFFIPVISLSLVQTHPSCRFTSTSPPQQDEPTTVAEALSVIQHTHERWQSLMAGQAEHDADFWLGETPETAAGDGW